eukprot:TRINITY_DN8200_c0_g1_i5.p1 TRINITY_DN8200_c0_g1~~TRINITY_DN8200_c0_g1_i5.p1  ORF type:complete len:106 (+),score=9.87 TRINITY_DN8200_c0_g1_i5:185-502(+)
MTSDMSSIRRAAARATSRPITRAVRNLWFILKSVRFLSYLATENTDLQTLATDRNILAKLDSLFTGATDSRLLRCCPGTAWRLTPHVLCVDTTAYSALIPLLTLR